MLKLATKFCPDREALERAYVAGFRYAEFYLDETVLDRWQTVAEQARRVSAWLCAPFSQPPHPCSRGGRSGHGPLPAAWM